MIFMSSMSSLINFRTIHPRITGGYAGGCLLNGESWNGYGRKGESAKNDRGIYGNATYR